MRIAPLLAVGLLLNTIAHADAPPAKAPFNYLWGKAYHVMPGTHNNESGYFSLVEGKDGKIYIGAAKYGVDSFLIEFDPQTEKQRIVVDTNKVTGTHGTGYAAQSKIHTKNFVGPSGMVYVGSKEGYASQEETASHDIPAYPGGYVMTYDPKREKATNLGMPWPGQGIGDVVADETNKLLYIVTCEDQHWMTYDLTSKHYRWLGPDLFMYASTIVNKQGIANAITKDYRMARYDPVTNKLATVDIVIDGKKLEEPEYKDRTGWIPNWSLARDGKTAYLLRMSYPELYELDLSGPLDKPIQGKMVGRMLEGHKFTDSRSCIAVGPDEKVYAAMAVPNDTKFGDAYELTHEVSYDPETKQMKDYGVVGVKNPDFFNFKAGPDGKTPPFSHGYKTLPDGVLTPQYQPLGSIVAHDGTVYMMILYPFTLLRIPPENLHEPRQ